MPKPKKTKDYVAHFKPALPGWGCVKCKSTTTATQIAVMGSGLQEGRCDRHGKKEKNR